MWVAAAAAAALAASAGAQSGAHGPAAPGAAAARVERLLGGVKCDALVMVNNAARQRESAAGRALGSMLGSSHAFPETEAAWRELAGALDWPVETAFDELLGRRVTVVVRGADGPEPAWALLTEVSLQTERRLREKLKASPRGTVEGLCVLSVEDGKYELVVGRATPGVDPNLAGTPGATAEVLLCPGGDCPLEAELAPSLVSRTGLATPAPAWRAGEAERESDLIVVMRPGGGAGGRFLTLTASLEQNGWEARLACSPDVAWGRPAGLSEVRPWSDGAFAGMERDALAASMGVIGSARWSGRWGRLAALESVMPALEAGPCGQLAALVVRPAGRGAEPRVVHGEPEPLLAAGDRLVRVPDGRAMGERAAPPLSVTLAVESRQGCRAVSEGDEAVARLVTRLRTGEDEPGERPVVRLEVGVPETETRTLSLSDFPVQEAYAGTVKRWFGDEPVVRWGEVRGAGMQASAGRGRAATDWWFASISPAGSGGPAAGVAAALLGPETGTVSRRLSIGVVRPAGLAAYLDDGDEDRGWMRWVDAVRWEAWLGTDGNVEGRVSVRMVGGR